MLSCGQVALFLLLAARVCICRSCGYDALSARCPSLRGGTFGCFCFEVAQHGYAYVFAWTQDFNVSCMTWERSCCPHDKLVFCLWRYCPAVFTMAVSCCIPTSRAREQVPVSSVPSILIVGPFDDAVPAACGTGPL